MFDPLEEKEEMKLKNTINKYRRVLLHGLTKNIGKGKVMDINALGTSAEIKKILICRPNQRLGNLLLITPLLQEVENLFPHCSIDLFVKGNLGSVVFQNYDTIDRIIALPKRPFRRPVDYVKSWLYLRKKQYDLVINVDPNSSSGRLSTKFSRSEFKIFDNFDTKLTNLYYNDVEHIAKAPVYGLRFFIRELDNYYSIKPVADLNLKLSFSEKTKGRRLLDDLLDDFSERDNKVIALFTYATGAKCYSRDWWHMFYGELKLRFPDYNIIELLPSENVSQIDFKAPYFYSQNVREIASLLSNVDLFIGADSGIMHLASASGVPVVGLFSITSIFKYEPYNTNSIAIDTNLSPVNTIIDAADEILNSKIEEKALKKDIAKRDNSSKREFGKVNTAVYSVNTSSLKTVFKVFE